MAGAPPLTEREWWIAFFCGVLTEGIVIMIVWAGVQIFKSLTR
jgi:hypothetical protein